MQTIWQVRRWIYEQLHAYCVCCMHIIFHADWGSNSIVINCERFTWILCAWPRTQKDNHFLSTPKSADNEPFCERWNRVKITMLPPKPKYGIQNMLAHPVWLTSLSHILWLYQIRKSIKSAACFHSQKFLSRARKERQKWACWNAYHTLIQYYSLDFLLLCALRKAQSPISSQRCNQF